MGQNPKKQHTSFWNPSTAQKRFFSEINSEKTAGVPPHSKIRKNSTGPFRHPNPKKRKFSEKNSKGPIVAIRITDLAQERN